MRPSFGPILGVASLPLAASVLAVLALRRGTHGRMSQAALLGAAVAEMLWAVGALAMVGFAVAARGG
ncbi:MAG TPA: hypothetical protein VFC99_10695 [Acidimicrobiia bacterium]|nr:hypothetical protein [Acidimicrobiia bacterium]